MIAVIDPEIAKLLYTAVTGSAGAIVVLILWVYSLHRQVKDLGAKISEKDAEISNKDDKILDITKEAVVAIRLSLDRIEAEDSFRERMSRLMEKIEDHLRGS